MPENFVEDLHGESAYQGFAVREILVDTKTDYQHMQIFSSERFGRMLILDGIVQTTECDEFMYHEMLVHVPMFTCVEPRRVLIVGGGDGGSLREVLKHDVDSVDMVEIDREVVESCVEWLPSLNDAGKIYEDPRANLVIADAFEYLQSHDEGYDVIICDSTDPIGAGEVLFSKAFYSLLQKRLRSGGVIALQNGVVFLQPEEPYGTLKNLRELGLRACCYTTVVPTYYGGFMTLAFATNDDELDLLDATRIEARWRNIGLSTRCYTPEYHIASFQLPKWITDIIEGHNGQ